MCVYLYSCMRTRVCLSVYANLFFDALNCYCGWFAATHFEFAAIPHQTKFLQQSWFVNSPKSDTSWMRKLRFSKYEGFTWIINSILVKIRTVNILREATNLKPIDLQHVHMLLGSHRNGFFKMWTKFPRKCGKQFFCSWILRFVYWDERQLIFLVGKAGIFWGLSGIRSSSFTSLSLFWLLLSR